MRTWIVVALGAVALLGAAAAQTWPMPMAGDMGDVVDMPHGNAMPMDPSSMPMSMPMDPGTCPMMEGAMPMGGMMGVEAA